MTARAPYLILAVLSAVLMGTIGVISRTTGLAAETIAFYRLFFGALLMLAYLVLGGHLDHLRHRPSGRLALTGAFLAGFIVCYVQAMNHTTMANAIMVIYLAPVTAAVVAHFALEERLTRSRLLLIGLALLGFAMMMEFRLEWSGGDSELVGLGFAGLAMLAYAGFILGNRTFPPRLHACTKTFYQLLFGALCLLPFVWWQEVPDRPGLWAWLVAAGLFPGFLAILFAVMALQVLPAATFGTLAYLEPITVILFGWLLFEESLTLVQLGGCALIIFSGCLQGFLVARKPAAEHGDE